MNMRVAGSPIDITKVRTVVYHMPDGQQFSINMEGIEQFVELGPGRVCDTSDIDGVLHFFPRGNA
ncbi:MAG: hypothetical protein NTW42_11835 [Deltaproteobacteria bacterium]|jgi:hypothetical protein|nr:hypothetical protein [Deltaproteobacteria bacterium]MCX5865737.1 hypothetical protein [Deltaproteobacteria bacterium]